MGGKTFKDVIKTTVVEVDLHATDLDGSTVSNQYEEDPGVDLHFNIDNDNDSSNSVPPSPSTKLPGADYYESTNPVTNEDDVKSLEMSLLPSLDFGQVILSNQSSAWLWKSPTKGPSNFVMAGSESKTWDLSVVEERNDFLGLCSTLHAEGMNISSGDIVLIYEYPVVGNDIHSDKVCYDFIAAYCGDQPKTEGVHHPGTGQSQRAYFEGLFPLKRCEWSITVNSLSDYYNCIAYSVDETFFWYNKLYSVPGTNIRGIDQEYGNPTNGVFEDTDMDTFYHVKKDWSLITSGTDEEKAEQAEAMYYSGYHAARKRSCSCGAGKWIMYTSKCGEWERIEHVWNQLNSSTYGQPTRFYK